MHLTDHTDLGLRVLILLGSVAPERLPSHEIASRYGLSFSHIQKVVRSLEGAGFVRTFRGRNGGVQLARMAEDITVGEVVRELEPHMHFVRCLRPGASGCVLDGGCALTGVMLRAKAALLQELDEATVGEVIAGSPFTRRLVGQGDVAPKKPVN